MKVKCVRLLDSEGKKVEPEISSLKLEKVYQVFGMYIDPSGKRKYQIISHDRDPGWATMGYHSAECFEIVSTIVPSNWRVKIRGNGWINIAPEAWQEPDFLESFYDSDPATYPIFERERDIILEEDP